MEGTRKRQKSRTSEDLRQRDQLADHGGKDDDVGRGDRLVCPFTRSRAQVEPLVETVPPWVSNKNAVI